MPDQLAIEMSILRELIEQQVLRATVMLCVTVVTSACLTCVGILRESTTQSLSTDSMRTISVQHMEYPAHRMSSPWSHGSLGGGRSGPAQCKA